MRGDGPLSKAVIEERHGRKVILMDSISSVAKEDAGHVVVSGSHGGMSAAECATAFPLALVFFNDAGVGKSQAGIAALAILDKLGVPAGTASNLSAEIGNARDMWDNGTISHLNFAALGKGLRIGQPISDAVYSFLEEP